MTGLFDLLIAVLVVGLMCYGVWWICLHFQMPRVIFWVVGGILLLVLLDYAAHQLGLVSGPLLPK
jgi:hypothetical protein